MLWSRYVWSAKLLPKIPGNAKCEAESCEGRGSSDGRWDMAACNDQ